MAYVVPSPLVGEASSLARFLLRHQPQRLAHVETAGRRASEVARLLSSELDGEAVVAAALLHDIGYSADLVRTGFHPLDGALLLARTGWPDMVVRLVAHHSYASMVAPYHGLEAHLEVIEPVHGLPADTVTFSDLTAGMDGTGTTIALRIADMRSRHDDDSRVPAHVREARYRLLASSASRVLDALALRVGERRPLTTCSG